MFKESNDHPANQLTINRRMRDNAFSALVGRRHTKQFLTNICKRRYRATDTDCEEIMEFDRLCQYVADSEAQAYQESLVR